MGVKIVYFSRISGIVVKKSLTNSYLFCFLIGFYIFVNYKIILLENKQMGIIQAYINEITALCELHRVESLYAFGSVLTDKFSSDSDIDLIVDFKPIKVEEYADNYFDFKFSLEDMLNRPIDLLEAKAIKNPYFKKSVNAQKQLIYG